MDKIYYVYMWNARPQIRLLETEQNTNLCYSITHITRWTHHNRTPRHEFYIVGTMRFITFLRLHESRRRQDAMSFTTLTGLHAFYVGTRWMFRNFSSLRFHLQWGHWTDHDFFTNLTGIHDLYETNRTFTELVGGRAKLQMKSPTKTHAESTSDNKDERSILMNKLHIVCVLNAIKWSGQN